MSRGDTIIPTDLVIEILSRLPARSIARCRCVSKQWSSMLLRPYFPNLFLTRTSARPPRLLFAVRRSGDWCFFTSPLPQDFQKKLSGSADTPQLHVPFEICSSPATVDFHMKFPGDGLLKFRGHASGFILFHRPMESPRDAGEYIYICNPSTGQYMDLPLPKERGCWHSLIGFDPIDKQFKVLLITFQMEEGKIYSDQIMTLGTRHDSSWREINCPLKHFPVGEGICINGVLYYLARSEDEVQYYYGYDLIVCFDVRSETFKFIYKSFIDVYGKVINYKGKLGVITSRKDIDFNLCMWVIKDVENPESEWSEYFPLIPPADEVFHTLSYSVVGVTPTGEIVLSLFNASTPFSVVYIDPETKTNLRVEIQGLLGSVPTYSDVKVIADYVEDLTTMTTEE